MTPTSLIFQSIDQTFYHLTIFQIYFNRNTLIFIAFKYIQLIPIFREILGYEYITGNSLSRITELNTRTAQLSTPTTLLQMPTNITGFPASPNPFITWALGCCGRSVPYTNKLCILRILKHHFDDYSTNSSARRTWS